MHQRTHVSTNNVRILCSNSLKPKLILESFKEIKLDKKLANNQSKIYNSIKKY